MPEIHTRLRADPPAGVADLARGMGWSSIAMARAYPKIVVDGLDLDEDAIAAARRNAEQAGLADRVRYSATDAALLPSENRHDLVTIFEALHDMSRPVATLRTALGLLTDGGTVLVADTRTAEEFTVPASERERQDYGWSLVSYLPGAMGDPDTAAAGHHDAPGHAASLRDRGRLRRSAGAADRHRLLALLPTDSVAEATAPSPIATAFRHPRAIARR